MQYCNVVLQKRKLLSLTQHISLTFSPLHLCSSKWTHHSPLRIEALVTCQRRTYSDLGYSKNTWGKNHKYNFYTDVYLPLHNQYT